MNKIHLKLKFAQLKLEALPLPQYHCSNQFSPTAKRAP